MCVCVRFFVGVFVCEGVIVYCGIFFLLTGECPLISLNLTGAFTVNFPLVSPCTGHSASADVNISVFVFCAGARTSGKLFLVAYDNWANWILIGVKQLWYMKASHSKLYFFLVTPVHLIIHAVTVASPWWHQTIHWLHFRCQKTWASWGNRVSSVPPGRSGIHVQGLVQLTAPVHIWVCIIECRPAQGAPLPC